MTKQRRLEGFDYRTPAAYFVTICAHERRIVFESREVQNAVIQCWKAIPGHFDRAQLDSFVVMPNHVHGIIVIEDSRRAVGALYTAHLQPEAPSLLTIVQTFKGAVTRNLRNEGLIPLDGQLWQRSFYDRVIRDEPELDRVREYIANNPADWAYDRENPDVEPNTTYVSAWGWLEGAEPAMVSAAAR